MKLLVNICVFLRFFSAPITGQRPEEVTIQERLRWGGALGGRGGAGWGSLLQYVSHPHSCEARELSELLLPLILVPKRTRQIRFVVLQKHQETQEEGSAR